MFRMFGFGVVLGVAGAVALLYFVPAVDQGRERSIVSVQPNGGKVEAFHVNLPTDRIFAGRAGAETTFPVGVEWPEHLDSDNTQIELFKIRNAQEKVIGVASRVVADGSPGVLEWALHMPARGTMYVTLNAIPSASGSRAGQLRSGTREFAELRGTIVERFIPESTDSSEAGAGRLELISRLVSPESTLDDLPIEESVADNRL